MSDDELRRMRNHINDNKIKISELEKKMETERKTKIWDTNVINKMKKEIAELKASSASHTEDNKNVDIAIGILDKHIDELKERFDKLETWVQSLLDLGYNNKEVLRELKERIINSEVVMWKFFKMKYDLAKKYGNGDIYKFYGELLTSLEVEKKDSGGDKDAGFDGFLGSNEARKEHMKKPSEPTGISTFILPREDFYLPDLEAKGLIFSEGFRDYIKKAYIKMFPDEPPVKREDLQWVIDWLQNDDIENINVKRWQKFKEAYGIE